MGQNESNNPKVQFFRTNKTELELIVDGLNIRCHNCFPDGSLVMIFAVKYKDDKEDKSLSWRFSVRIRLFTTRDGKSYCKTYTLYEFLKLYRSFYQLFDAADSSSDLPNWEHLSIFQHESCNLQEGQCIICFDGQPDAVLPCTHAYCSRCIDAFKRINQRFCPLCRHELTGGSDESWVVTEKPDKETIKQYLQET